MEGVNKISLSCVDARTFCFGVRLVRRRTLEQVSSILLNFDIINLKLNLVCCYKSFITWLGGEGCVR